jgi:hypothetical protein
MKAILSLIFISICFLGNSQVFKCTMYDYQFFQYPERLSLGEAMDSNLVIYDTVSYTTQTRFVFDLEKMVLTYTLSSGKVETHQITTVIKSKPFIDVDVLIEGKGIYNYLFGDNVNDDISMIVRERFVKNGMVNGFFTNKVVISDQRP